MQSHLPIKLAGLASAVALYVVMTSASSLGQTYPGVKCIVNGNSQCKVRHAAKWHDGQVYFATRSAADDFRSRHDAASSQKRIKPLKPSLILKANHQLVLTGQYSQRRCPISGKSISDQFQIRVAGLKIYLHDSISKSRLQAVDSTLGRAKLVFADSTFTNAFSKTLRQTNKKPTPVQTTVPGANRPVSIADANETTAELRTKK
jgi:hypothetical protein